MDKLVVLPHNDMDKLVVLPHDDVDKLVVLSHVNMEKLVPSVTIRIEKWCTTEVTSCQASVSTHPSSRSLNLAENEA